MRKLLKTWGPLTESLLAESDSADVKIFKIWNSEIGNQQEEFEFFHKLWFTDRMLRFKALSDINPYRQIPETISKKRAVTQGISRKLFPGVFQILQFWGVTQGIFRKLFPGKFHEYLPMKKIFFPKNGAWLRGFSGNYFQYLEKVSGNSPGSLPEFTKFQISFKIIDFGKSFQKIPWVMPQNRSNRFWKKFPENPLSHYPDFSIQSTLNSNILIR